ncbi:cysteine hydrolase family protein [soil metagenome]
MSQNSSPQRQALIVIDMQQGFNDATFWGKSSNPDCEENVELLMAAWKAHDLPIVVVRHDSRSPKSPLRSEQAGNNLMPFVSAVTADLLVTKQVNSAFYGDPGLHEWLQEQGVNRLVICGIQTNMCVETTARMAGNLGYEVTVPLDATRTFDLSTTVPGLGEMTLTADELMTATAVNLQAGGFARMVTTAEVTAALR